MYPLLKAILAGTLGASLTPIWVEQLLALSKLVLLTPEIVWSGYFLLRRQANG
jgi:hypothetical protein